MKNFSIFFAFMIIFFLNFYAAFSMENEEALRQSALSSLSENKLSFSDDKRMNYTLNAKVPLETFKNDITKGWHLALMGLMYSTTSSRGTSTHTTNRGRPTVNEISSGPHSSEGKIYTIYNKGNLNIGTLQAQQGGGDNTQGSLSGAHGLEAGAAHAPTTKMREKMLRQAEDMKKLAGK